MDWLASARASLSAVGVGVSGIADGRGFDHVLPGVRSVVVFASGGPGIWSHIDPRDAHPVDDLVRRVLPHSTADRRWLRCAMDETLHVDFIGLAQAAGLGHRSRLGLLVHPVFGPWLGLRAACFTTERLTPDGPLPHENPCVGCAAPCADACPASAIGPRTLELDPCLAWQATQSTCQGGCLARSACVVGPQHAYSAAQHRYHHHPPSRAAILAAHPESP